MKILFVGNSYTLYHDLPGAIVAMARCCGETVEVGRYLRGGASLETHWMDNAGVAEPRGEFGKILDPARVGGLDALLRSPWDVAILQGQSRDTLETPEAFLRYGQKLAAMLRRAGVGRILLYQTWARAHLPETQSIITDGYRTLAQAIHADVAPVGEAWRIFREPCPAVPLHVADQSHPTPIGTYLAACVMTARLWSVDSGTLPNLQPRQALPDAAPPDLFADPFPLSWVDAARRAAAEALSGN